MHAQFDAGRTAVRGVGFAPLRHTQQLDAVAELVGVADVGRLQLGDAFDVGAIKLHRHAEGDRTHDRDLVGGVYAFDVERGIGLRVTQALGLREHLGKVRSLGAHLGEDEVGRAVDDAGHPFDAVGGEPFAQRLDDRDTAGHRGFKGHRHTALACRLEDLAAVHRQQRLVGGDNVLAGLDRLHHQRARDAGAADQLDDDIDRRIGEHLRRIAHHLRRIADDRAGTLHVHIGHHRDLDAAARAAADFLLVALQHLEGAGAHGADAQKAHLNRFHRVGLSGYWCVRRRYEARKWSMRPIASVRSSALGKKTRRK